MGKGTGAGECIPLPPPPAHPVKTIFAAGINVHNNVKLMTIMLNNTRKKRFARTEKLIVLITILQIAEMKLAQMVDTFQQRYVFVKGIQL